MQFEKSSYHSLIGMIVWIIMTLMTLKKKSLNFKFKSNLLENISRASAIFSSLHDVFLWEILPTSDFYESSPRCCFYSFGYFFFLFPFFYFILKPRLSSQSYLSYSACSGQNLPQAMDLVAITPFLAVSPPELKSDLSKRCQNPTHLPAHSSLVPR